MAWHSRAGEDGALRTVGALILAGSEVRYVAAKAFKTMSTEFNAALSVSTSSGCSAFDTFWYYVNSGNGQTNEWSEVEEVEGKNVDEIAADLINQIP